MARWEKLLTRMRDSVRCVGFTYDDAASVLAGLGFSCVETGAGGSHRRWAQLHPSGQRVIIGLVNHGHGDLKPVYIKQMLRLLKEHELMPQEEPHVKP